MLKTLLILLKESNIKLLNYIDGFSDGINKSNFSFLDGSPININNFSVDDRILIYNESNILRFKNT